MYADIGHFPVKPADDEHHDETSTLELDKQALLPINWYTHASAAHQPENPPVSAGVSEDRMLGLLQQAFDRLEHPAAEDSCPDEQSMAYLHTVMLDPAQFVASNLTKHLVAWQALFARLGHSKGSRHVLDWVANGNLCHLLPLDKNCILDIASSCNYLSSC